MAINTNNATVPIVMGTSGLQPTSPQTLLANLLALVSATNPGYTANLPGSLIEDISSTDVGALTLIDQALVEFVNSITPYGANAFLLNQLGQIYGVQQGIGSNTSVYVTFSGSPGFVIGAGFVVSDGSYQYTVQDGGIISASGQSTALYCIATSSGSWAVPVGTVTQLITSVPSGVTLTCTNLTAGLPGATAQPIENYQAQVIQAGLATAQGVPTFLKTQLEKVSGVQTNLVSIQNKGAGSWEIICGGGDPYQVANAIFQGIPDISMLVGSTLGVTGITNALPAVVTTNLNHGYSTGQVINIAGVTGMSGINGVPYVAVVLTENTFSLAVQISSITWSGGTVSVTTAEPHGLPTGTSTGTIYGCTPTAYNGSYTFTKTGTNTFTYPLASNPGTITVKGYSDYDSASDGSYTSGGVVTPNLRNVTVSINDYPDTYSVTFVNPPVQTVSLAITWNSISPNIVSNSAVASLVTPNLVNYINNIVVGQPISVFEIQEVFQSSISSILPVQYISKIQCVVEINGIVTAPSSGSLLIYGDPESYFSTSASYITIAQG